MSTIYKWRIRCNTDDKFEYIWNETEPVICPSNGTHKIDTSLTCIVDKIKPNVLKIKEESTETGGNFRCETRTINIEPNTINTNIFNYKYPVSIFAVYFTTTSTHEGDIVESFIAPDTPIGLITSNVVKNDNIINVSSSVIENVMIGYDIKITDKDNTDSLGKIIFIDKERSQITTENKCINNFKVSNQTYILLTIKILENYEIGPPTQHIIGDSKIGGMHVPANTNLLLKYINKSLDTSKKIVFKIEYTY